MTSTHAEHPLLWASDREGNVGKRSGLRRLMASFRGELRSPDGEAKKLGDSVDPSVEDRVRREIVSEIMAEIEEVVSAPAHVYEGRIAQLIAGPPDRLFWDGVVEGLLMAVDVAGPRDQPSPD
jgi:hypothetical protein